MSQPTQQRIDDDRRAAQRERMGSAKGFVAALDQSGGSTPKALALYGIAPQTYQGEEEMFELVHRMRTRIMTSPAFTGERILAAIMFSQTMDRQVAGRLTGDYLWDVKGVVPILKVDVGLAERADDVQLMKPNPGLPRLLERAVSRRVFGTKMRSVVHAANPSGIADLLDQQVATARAIVEAGLVPIIEPEISIEAPDKAAAEELLLAGLAARLDALPTEATVMLKLTIPEEPDLYAPLIAHPRVLRVVALSGGYTRQDACRRLARNKGMIASFSRALTQGLTVDQSEAAFDATLAAAIEEIYAASIT